MFVSFGHCIVCSLRIMALITPFVSSNISYCFMKKHFVRKGYVIFTLPKYLFFSYLCEIVLYSFLYFCAVALIICYQLLAHGRWFSPGTPASSTTKTGCHEILLKGALKKQKSTWLQNMFALNLAFYYIMFDILWNIKVVLTPYPLTDPEKKAFHGWYLPLRM